MGVVCPNRTAQGLGYKNVCLAKGTSSPTDPDWPWRSILFAVDLFSGQCREFTSLGKYGSGVLWRIYHFVVLLGPVACVAVSAVERGASHPLVLVTAGYTTSPYVMILPSKTVENATSNKDKYKSVVLLVLFKLVELYFWSLTGVVAWGDLILLYKPM